MLATTPTQRALRKSKTIQNPIGEGISAGRTLTYPTTVVSAAPSSSVGELAREPGSCGERIRCGAEETRNCRSFGDAQKAHSISMCDAVCKNRDAWEELENVAAFGENYRGPPLHVVVSSRVLTER